MFRFEKTHSSLSCFDIKKRERAIAAIKAALNTNATTQVVCKLAIRTFLEFHYQPALHICRVKTEKESRSTGMLKTLATIK